MSQGDHFDVEMHSQPDDALVVELAGDLDASQATWVEDTLAAAAPHHKRMIVQMADVSFLDSGGIRMLQTLQARAKILDIVLSFEKPSEAVLRTLTAAGLVALVDPSADLRSGDDG